MILDTTFLIDLMRDDDGAVEALDALERREAPVEVTAVTAYELHYGAHRYHDTESEVERIVAVLDLISGLENLPLTWRDGARAGKIMHDLESDGDRVDFHDAIIAAAGLNRGLPVLTRNEKHFENIEGLALETY